MSRLLSQVCDSFPAGKGAAVARGRLWGASRSAFTMAEVIFAIIILGVGLILLAAAFPVGIKQSEKIQEATNAGLIAQHAYDQLTKVVASGVIPDSAWVAKGPSAIWPGAPVERYGDQSASPVIPGKALTMGFIDGAMATDTLGQPAPDLRAKLVYPVSIYAEADPLTAKNPTWADDCPQDQNVANIGHAAYTPSPTALPIPYLSVWGFRQDGGIWQENVQWVYPADRRYYWYAFYRQMNEDPDGYPSPLVDLTWTGAPERPAKRNAVRNDHITRRTYRVTIVACKTAGPIQPPVWFTSHVPPKTPVDYAAQWSAGADVWRSLAPVRIPVADDQIAGVGINYQNDATGAWLIDAAAGGHIATGIAKNRIGRGDTVLDAWANVYQIADIGTDRIRLDRPVEGIAPSSPIDASALPLWFNPNAIAVFPTIVTKQADLP